MKGHRHQAQGENSPGKVCLNPPKIYWPPGVVRVLCVYLAIVRRVFVKGSQEGEENGNGQIGRGCWCKGWDHETRTALSDMERDKLHRHSDAQQKQVSSRKGMSFQLCHKFTFS